MELPWFLELCRRDATYDPGVAYLRCKQYLWERSPPNDEDGRPKLVVPPRAIYRLKFEPPFQFSDELEQLLHKWIYMTQASVNFNCTPFFVKYIFRMVTEGQCVIVLDTTNDRYVTLRYNPSRGIYQQEAMTNMIVPLQNAIFKVILSNMHCKDPYGPLDMMLKLYDSLGNLINMQKLIKMDLSSADIGDHQSKPSGDRYLVFPNSTTYDLREAKFVSWDPSQICMYRAEIDPSLGLGEYIDHYSVEVHPLRGGREYLRKMLFRIVDCAHAIFCKQAQFKQEYVCKTFHRDRVKKTMTKLFSVEEMRRAVNDDELFEEQYMIACRYLSVRHMITSKPDAFNLIYNDLVVCGKEDDDGGPVVFVKKRMTYEEKIWAIFDDIFGSRRMSEMVMNYLAIGLSTGSRSREILYLHGEAVNGKSVFINILSAALGGSGSKLIINLNGEYFTGRSNHMDTTFRNSNSDLRFLFVSEMSVLEVTSAGKALLKRFTGGDIINQRAPYAALNKEFRVTAKIVATSNELPYFHPGETAEISRFLIVPMLSYFYNGKSALRKRHLLYATNDRHARRLFGAEYPLLFSEYVELLNAKANTMFDCPAESMGAVNTLLPSDTPTLTARQEPGIKSIPVYRHMLGDSSLGNEEVIRKLGAALMRILTKDVIPRMGGVDDTNYKRYTAEFEEYIRKNTPVFASYKNVITAMLSFKLVRVATPHAFVPVEELRELVKNDIANFKRTVTTDMFGILYTGKKVPHAMVNAHECLKSANAFELERIGIKVSKIRPPGGDGGAGGVRVIKRFMLANAYADMIAREQKRTSILDAVVDDPHLERYETIYSMEQLDTLEKQDAYTRRKFFRSTATGTNEYGTDVADSAQHIYWDTMNKKKKKVKRLLMMSNGDGGSSDDDGDEEEEEDATDVDEAVGDDSTTTVVVE
nr:uncharacterized protein LOC129386847 [Dermacentor andersoni]